MNNNIHGLSTWLHYIPGHILRCLFNCDTRQVSDSLHLRIHTTRGVCSAHIAEHWPLPTLATTFGSCGWNWTGDLETTTTATC